MNSARWECLGMHSMMKCLKLMKHTYGSHYIEKADWRNTHQTSVDTESAEELLGALWEGGLTGSHTHLFSDSVSGLFPFLLPTPLLHVRSSTLAGCRVGGAEVEPAVPRDAAGHQQPVMQPALGAQSRTRASVGRFLNLGGSLYNTGYLSHQLCW